MAVGLTLDGFGVVVAGDDEDLVLVGLIRALVPTFIMVVRKALQNLFATGWVVDETGLETVIAVDFGDELDVAGEVGAGDFEHGFRAVEPVDAIA